MKKTIDYLSKLLEHKNISLPQSARNSKEGQQTEGHVRCHALTTCFTQSKAYLIHSGSSNHMVSSKESFTTLDLLGGPNIHMRDDSLIPSIGRGSIKIQHGEFKNVIYVPCLAANMLFAYQMTHTGSPKRVTFDFDSVGVTEKSIGNIIEKEFSNHASKEYDLSHFLPASHPTTLFTHANNTSKLWNEIFGHLNFKYLHQIHNEKMVESLPLIPTSDGVCPGFLVR